MKQTNNAGFGKIRSYLWPIYRSELTKLVPMLIMLFGVCFNYSILRNLKDSILVTESSSGAAIIPFIKVWVMLPAAIIMTMLFTYLSNHFSRKTVFHIIILSFLAFFLLFALFIYPHREALHPYAFADYLESTLPLGFKAVIDMFRYWTLTCFYVISELWGSIVLTVLVWGFANEVTRISEATRFYSVLSIGTNTAAIIAGQVAVLFTSHSYNPSLIFGNDAWEQTLVKLMVLITLSGLAVLFSFNWMTKNVLSVEERKAELINPAKLKKKLNFKESLQLIARSKYLLCIAALVVSYFLVINLVEVIWKDQLRVLYPLPQQYNIYINNLTSTMGVISTLASVLMVGILAKLGWTKTALMTPIVLLVTSVAFFICLVGGDTLAPIVSTLLGTTPLAIAVFLGSVQNCFSKAAKYSLFDTTKEMAFIPLGSDEKLKGKAAIDGIGSRLGKAGSSCIHQGLYFIFFSLSASAPYVALVLLVVIGMWILAIISLGKQFDGLRAQTQDVPQVDSTPAQEAVVIENFSRHNKAEPTAIATH